MEDQWYVARNKQRVGPFSTSQLCNMAETGRLGRTEMVLRVGDQKWCPAGTVKDFFLPVTVVERGTPLGRSNRGRALSRLLAGHRRLVAGAVVAVVLLIVAGLALSAALAKKTPAPRVADVGDSSNSQPKHKRPLTSSRPSTTPNLPDEDEQNSRKPSETGQEAPDTSASGKAGTGKAPDVTPLVKVDGLPVPPVQPAPKSIRGVDPSKLASDPTLAFGFLAGTVQNHSLYFDARRKKGFTPPTGPYGGLGMLLGVSNGNEAAYEQIEDHSRAYDALGTVESPYLRRAAGEFYGNALARMQLAEANDRYGNTQGSSIRKGYDLMRQAFKYEMSRDADVAELRQSLQDRFPRHRVIVTDAPLSDESRQHLSDLLRGAGSLKNELKDQVMVSVLLSHAEMAQSERTARLWEKWLLPLARKRGGPPAKEPPVTLTGAWGRLSSGDPSVLLAITLKKTTEQALSGASVMLELENEWGDKTTGYHFAGTIIDSAARVPIASMNYRWGNRILRYSNTIKVRWSIWTDQASYEGGTLELENPTPIAKAASIRQDVLRYDKEDRARGEALGAYLRKTQLLPLNPNRVARRLMETVAEGSQFVFIHPDTKKPAVLHTLHQDWRKGDSSFALLDVKSGKPIDQDSEKIGGKAGVHRQVGASVTLDNKWQLFLGNDEQPMMNFPSQGPAINTQFLTQIALGTPPEFDPTPWPTPKKVADQRPPGPRAGDDNKPKQDTAGTGKTDKDGRSKFNGKLYKFFPEVLTWSEARAKCEKLGGQLAVVTSKQQNDFLTKLVLGANKREAWLGATNEKDQKTWVWVDGTKFEYKNWERTQPNNKGGVEHYLMLWAVRKGEWCDQPDRAIGHAPGYLCEWKATETHDPFRAGTVWVDGDLRLTVLERKDNTFKAKFEAGAKIERVVVGTVDGNKIMWLAKDVVSGKPDKGGDNTGILDEDGETIRFTWKQGSSDRKFTLHLQTKP